MKKDFPKLIPQTLEDVLTLCRYIVKERTNDVNDFNNLNNVFISGRKVAKIATGSLDVADTDRVGDFNFDTSYLYILVDNGGSAEWRRASLSSW